MLLGLNTMKKYAKSFGPPFEIGSNAIEWVTVLVLKEGKYDSVK